MSKIRQFDSGATRDTEEGKLNYIKALSPIVLQRYVEYIGKHRLQSDGNLRAWDNWKKGIPQQVYIESAIRHLIAVWMLHENYNAIDNRGQLVDIEESLCGVLFNVIGYLHELLKKKLEKETK